MKDIISSLNPKQQEAVKHKNGPLLILAGAGSGKTRALTHRAAYLIWKYKVNPQNILLLTFTNKAANEMKARIRKLGDNQLSTAIPWAGTFHAFCAKVLREDGYHLKIPPGFLIFDEGDQLAVIKEAMEKLQISPKEVSPSSVLATISQAKNELISPLEYLQYAKGAFQEQVSKIYPLYQKLLREQNALDFDDLLTETVRLFRENPATLEKYQKRYPYVLVDEWQDTNKAQYLLIKLLTSRSRNLCAVGDASQSIYSFRGADFRNLMYLKEDFRDLKIIRFEQNYRSTQKILDAAFAVIKHNRSHPVLHLWTENSKGENIKVYQARSETDEAEFIIRIINQMPYELKDYAVLYRTNAQSRIIEETFLRWGIPYILVGGTRFYERREVKDVLSFLRLIANPKDSLSKERVEKLGKKRLEKLLDLSRELKEGDFDHLSTTEIMDRALKATGYLDLYDPQSEEDFYRLENIKELRSVAAEFPDLISFLQNVMLIQEESLPADSPKSITSHPPRNAITLMTAHAAKGLEFPAVFMVGMEEGLFPHARSLFNPEDLEEERRLCYVGITRAKEKLFLSYAKRRFYFGKHSANSPSRFLSDIPEDLIDLLE